MALNPNIALSARGVELADPLAQYGRVMAIQQAGNQNALAQYQLGAAQRGEARDIARTNALAGAGTDETAVANALLRSGDIAGYSAFLKSNEERKTQRLTQQKTEGELFDTSMKQLRNFWGNVRTPEDAMAIHDATHKDPIINKRLLALGITEQMGRQQIIDAAQDPTRFAEFVKKAQLGAEKFMEMNKPTTSVGPTGIVQIPGLGGAATIVPGTSAAFQMTPAQIAANKIAQQQLGVSQDQLSLAREKFAFDQANPGFELQQDAEGNFFGVNKRTMQAVPVTMGGAAPAAAPAAPGAGMPGPRVSAPTAAPTQVIPGMTSVLDQPAAVPAAAPGSPFKGAPKNKELAVSEQQASYNLGRILDAAKEINAAIKKDPGALKPGVGEAAAASVGLSGTANVARNAQRQIVFGAQRDALDAMLYLATGAAYNKEQLEGQMAAYVPAFTDKPDAVEAKRTRMLGLIQNAKVRAGKAWTPEMDAAAQVLFQPIASGGKPAAGGVIDFGSLR